MKTARKNLPQSFQSDAAIAIYKKFMQLNLLKEKNNIAGYLSVNGEVDTLLFQQAIWHAKKNYFLPVMTGTPDEKLLFHPYNSATKTQHVNFNIIEPVPSDPILPQQLDLVLVPLVAFDEKCQRIGMGKGFYDKTFAFRKNYPSPLLIGLAYEMQRTHQLKLNDWDVALDIIITEQHVYYKK
tara:strand:- start:1001 stop:1546 length:546 start_codon:yes stop_codon:yes gene_type:complete